MLSEVAPRKHHRACVQSVEVLYPVFSTPGAWARAKVFRNPDGYFHCWMCHSVKIVDVDAFFVSSFLSLLSLAANWPPAPRQRLY